MHILSDNDYKILNSFQTEMQTSCNLCSYKAINERKINKMSSFQLFELK